MKVFNQRLRLWFLMAVLLLLSSGCATLDSPPAAKQAPPVPAAPWPHEESDLAPDPAITYGKLANGFRYVLMQNSTPRDRVSMHLDVQAGSIEETDPQQGVAHFLEHMMFNGSENFPPGELVKYFQRIGMEFGPDANAHTGFRETVYDIMLPKGDETAVAEGLTVLKDYARGALLLQSEVEKERKVILAEMRARDSAGYRTFVESIKFELPDYRISRRLPIGTKETIQKADARLLRDYYDAWYRPERMVLVMVGDMDLSLAEQMIRERFADLQPRAPALALPEMGRIDHAGLQTFYHHEKESGNTEVTLQVLTEAPETADTAAKRRSQLAVEVAHDILQDRLDRITRTSEAPFTRAFAGSDVYLGTVRYAVLTAECDPDQWRQTLQMLEQTLRQGMEYGVTKAELARVKKTYLADLKQEAAAAATRESGKLARRIIRSVNTDRVFRAPEQELAFYAPLLEELTVDQVNAALQKAWQPDHRLVMVTGNAEIAEEDTAPEVVIGQAYTRSTALAVIPPDAQDAATFPYLATPRVPGTIAERTEIPDLGITQVTFQNGVHLNIRSARFKKNEILSNLMLGYGRFAEPADKPGLSELSESVINESGLGEMDLETMKRALAGTTTSVSFNVGSGHFTLSGQSVPSELELLFQLYYAYLNDATVRPEAFDLSMKRFTQMYQQLGQAVEGAMTLWGQHFLAGGDSRFGLPALERFQSLTPGDVRSFALLPLEQDPIEVSVVGDLDVEKTIALAARYLGSLPPRGAGEQPQRTASLSFPSGERLSITVDTRIDKGNVYVAYPTDDIWNIGRTRRLAILANVLSDRLREVIREKLGATYSPYAYNYPSRDYDGYGYLQSVISIDPNDSEQVVAEIRRIAADLAQNGVSADELRRALDPTLNSIKDMRQENAYWLNTVLTGVSRHPEQLEWSRTIESDYRSITEADLSTMAAAYLKNARAAVIIVQPGTENRAVAQAAGR